MLYLSILLFLILLVLFYDLGGKQRNKTFFFNFVLILFILIDSFSYNVGVDDAGYRETFKYLSLDNFQRDILSVFRGEFHYMPGWQLLLYFAKFTVNDFIIVKIIQAIFLNYVVFYFIKEKAIYPFAVILLYGVFDYLLLNFNILRQSFAFAFFLLAYLSYDKGSLFKYYIFVTCAFLFHNSAIILYILPIFSIIKYKRKNIVIIVIAFVAITLYLISGSGLNTLLSFVGDNSDARLSYQINKYYYHYQGGAKAAVRFSSYLILTLTIDILVIISALKRSGNNRMAPFIIFYLITFIAQQLLPIMFRYRVYVDLFMFVILTNELYYYIKNKQHIIKVAIFFTIITLFSYSTITGYFITTGKSKAYIYQYYPYTSIWSKEKYERL